jgi:hypothetical protein
MYKHWLLGKCLPGPLELGLDPGLPSEACKVNVSVMKRKRQRGHPETEKVGEVDSCLDFKRKFTKIFAEMTCENKQSCADFIV